MGVGETATATGIVGSTIAFIWASLKEATDIANKAAEACATVSRLVPASSEAVSACRSCGLLDGAWSEIALFLIGTSILSFFVGRYSVAVRCANTLPIVETDQSVVVDIAPEYVPFRVSKRAGALRHKSVDASTLVDSNDVYTPWQS